MFINLPSAGIMYVNIFLWSLLQLKSAIGETGSAAATLKRFSKNEGFHRDLVTEVSIQLPLGGIQAMDGCDILLIEHLPSGVYVDVHQIEQMVEFGGPKVIVNDPIDIEQPEYLSLPHKILVYSQIKDIKENVLSTSVTLPVHLRYHRPQAEGGYVVVIQNHPQVFFKCKGNDGASSQNTQSFPCSPDDPATRCLWERVDYSSDSKEIEFSVPVGNSDLTFIITVVTLGTTVFGTLYILYTSVISCVTKVWEEEEKKAR